MTKETKKPSMNVSGMLESNLLSKYFTKDSNQLEQIADTTHKWCSQGDYALLSIEFHSFPVNVSVQHIHIHITPRIVLVAYTWIYIKFINDFFALVHKLL